MQIPHVLLTLILVIFWGFNYVVIQFGLDGVPPIFLAFSRFFLTSLPWVFFVKKPAIPWRMLLLYGVVMYALQFGFLFVGMKVGVAPGLASLILQLTVFFTILLGVIFFHERPHVWQIVGGIIAFGGIGIVACNTRGEVSLLGLILLIASAVSWSFGNVISKKLGKINMLSLVLWGSLVAWPPLLLLSFFLEGPQQILNCLQNLDWLSIGAILYITYISTLFGFGVWSWLIHRYPLGTIAPFTLLVPVTAIVGSILVLHEPFHTWKIWAALLVIAGLCINFLGPRLFGRRR